MPGKRISDREFSITIGTLLRTLSYFKKINPGAQGNFSEEDLHRKGRAEIMQEQLQATYQEQLQTSYEIFNETSISSQPMAFRTVTIPIHIVEEIQEIFKTLVPPKKRRKKSDK
jgi:hypothetical protein